MNPDQTQLEQALSHVRYEIESFLLCPDYDRSNQALEESVYFRKMAHCRALYHFFTKKAEQRKDTPKRVDDDMVSEDFEFQAKEIYGNQSTELLKRFNKDLLHLTYDRLTRTPESKPWPVELLFPPVEKRAKEFIDHILQHRTISKAERLLWEDLKRKLVKGLPLQASSSNTASVAILSIQLDASRSKGQP